MRRLLGGGIVLLLVLWFGIPAITSRSPFVAGDECDRVRAGAARQQGDRDDQPVHASSPAALSSRGAAVAVAGRRGGETESCCCSPAGRGLGGRRGRVRSARLARAAPLHVRGGRRGGHRGRRASAGCCANPCGGRLLPAGRASRCRGRLLRRSSCRSAVSRARAAHKDLRAQRVRTDADQPAAPCARRRRGRRVDPLVRRAADAPRVPDDRGVDARGNVARVGWKYGPAVASSQADRPDLTAPQRRLEDPGAAPAHGAVSSRCQPESRRRFATSSISDPGARDRRRRSSSALR